MAHVDLTVATDQATAVVPALGPPLGLGEPEVGSAPQATLAADGPRAGQTSTAPTHIDKLTVDTGVAPLLLSGGLRFTPHRALADR